VNKDEYITVTFTPALAIFY